MINQPVVSVIVPCYNHGQFLGEALTSVREQTFTDWECIVIDNGSTDNTKEVANQFVTSDKRFKYIFQENKGVSSARNKGIRSSSGKYILPLDADDKIGVTYLSEAVKILEANSAVKVVYCEAELFGDLKGRWPLPEFSMKDMLMENVVFCTAFYRRSDFDKTPGYNEKMVTGFEDWDFWLGLLESGGDVYKLPGVNFYYRIRKDSRNGRLMPEHIKELRKQVYLNHKELYEKHFDISSALFEWYLKKDALIRAGYKSESRIRKTILYPLRKLRSIFAKSTPKQ